VRLSKRQSPLYNSVNTPYDDIAACRDTPGTYPLPARLNWLALTF